jgi:hypothetical protein
MQKEEQEEEEEEDDEEERIVCVGCWYNLREDLYILIRNPNMWDQTNCS